MCMVERLMGNPRAERAAVRRAAMVPGRIVQLGTSKGRMYAGLSHEERLIAYRNLIERAWTASGRAMPAPCSRAELPGEVFEVVTNA